MGPPLTQTPRPTGRALTGDDGQCRSGAGFVGVSAALPGGTERLGVAVATAPHPGAGLASRLLLRARTAAVAGHCGICSGGIAGCACAADKFVAEWPASGGDRFRSER